MRGFGKSLIAGFIVLAGLVAPRAALAADPGSQASPTGKGIVGGGLLGGEVVMLVEAAASVKPGWAYAVGGGLGAVGGAVGGYFAEDGGNVDRARLSLYLLVGGMALALPTTVAVLSATSYEPVNYTEDRAPEDEPVAEPARQQGPAAAPMEKPTSRAPARRAPKVAAAPKLPPALLGVDQGTVTLSVPAVEVRQVYTRTEVATLGVKQQPSIAVPVLNVVF
jgi:hypothetical protein